MIYYLVMRHRAFTIEQFLNTWGESLEERPRVLFYETLPSRRFLEPGLYIFTDLERLSLSGLRLACTVAEPVGAAGAGFGVRNDSRLVQRRFDLLEKLHSEGINRFGVYRRPRLATPRHYPVCLRRELEHNGPMTGLLPSKKALRRATRQLLWRPRFYRRHDLIAVEYCETGDSDGLYRNYSAMRIGEQLIGRHILYNSQWMAKSAKLINEEGAAEELQYVRNLPERDMLWRVFQLSGIEYGRIDYAYCTGQMQVWEINTKPRWRWNQKSSIPGGSGHRSNLSSK